MLLKLKERKNKNFIRRNKLKLMKLAHLLILGLSFFVGNDKPVSFLPTTSATVAAVAGTGEQIAQRQKSLNLSEPTDIAVVEVNINSDDLDSHNASVYRQNNSFADDFVEITIEDTSLTPVIYTGEDSSSLIERCSEASSACNSECSAHLASRATDSILDCSLSTVSSVKNAFVSGSLSSNLRFWAEITSDKFILNLIENGYKIPFFTTPPDRNTKNNKSALSETSFVKEEISKLLLSGCITETTTKPSVINPLSVSVNHSGKKRLILDLRHVNNHIYKFSVKYEGLNILKQYLDSDYYMAKFDLKSGYHHIDIYPEHRTYLGFAWRNDAQTTKYYTFNVLPFGLSSACSIFTKVLRPLICNWRKLGFRIIMYLDDGIIVNNNKYLLSTQIEQIKSDLYKAGFFINEEKSIWKPNKQLEWLGISINLVTMEFELPMEKIVRTRNLINLTLKKSVTARQLSKVTGTIISSREASGIKTLLMTKRLQMCIRDSESWDRYLKISEGALEELLYWRSEFSKTKISCPIMSDNQTSLTIYTDASDVGGGGFIQELVGSASFFPWCENQFSESSTHRELRALLLMLYNFRCILKEIKVRWFCDNMNAVKLVKTGSMIPTLHEIILNINKLCWEYKIEIISEWIEREHNKIADSLSRNQNSDEWSVSNNVFNYFDKTWGPHTYDRFANSFNKKCTKFNSRSPCKFSLGTDCFNFDWNNETNWLVPPVHLIGRTVSHLKKCKANGTLVVPKWRSSYFWPLLCDEYGKFLYFVVDYVEYKNPTNFFHNTNSKSVFNEKFKSNVLVLKIRF